jgi:hypothetical protein
MGDIARLKDEIEQCAPHELAELTEWLLALDHDAWDRQIEADLAAGRVRPV